MSENLDIDAVAQFAIDEAAKLGREVVMVLVISTDGKRVIHDRLAWPPEGVDGFAWSNDYLERAKTWPTETRRPEAKA